jgi:hypothetical protein
MLGLARNRVALVLMVILPIVFYALILATTGSAPVTFLLPSVSSTTAVNVSRRDEALVFMGLAAVGFVSAFLAFHLITRQTDATRRLVLCGYRAWELVAARLTALVCAVAAVSVLSVVLLRMLFHPSHTGGVLAGFILVGLVYGCAGLLVGAMVKRDLEGMLAIVLITNVDVGWLQNPIFYSTSEHREIIRVLPAYFPAQVAMTSAFSDYATTAAVFGSLGYAAGLLIVALLLYGARMRIAPSD